MSFIHKSFSLGARPSNKAGNNSLFISGDSKPGERDAPCHNSGVSSEQISAGVRVMQANRCPNFVIERVISNKWGEPPVLALTRTDNEIPAACFGCSIVAAASRVAVAIRHKTSAA